MKQYIPERGYSIVDYPDSRAVLYINGTPKQILYKIGPHNKKESPKPQNSDEDVISGIDLQELSKMLYNFYNKITSKDR